MPIIDGRYVAPTWANNASPAIDAAELQDICDSIEANQTPTDHASTEETYGKGTGTKFGHLKVVDSPDESLPASTGVAVSPYALGIVDEKATLALNNANSALTQVGGKAKASVIGAYMGTGTYGVNNKNSILFTELPTAVFISNRPNVPNSAAMIILLPKLKIGYSFLNTDSEAAKYNTLLHVDTVVNTVRWYSTSGAGAQGNLNGNVYSYNAIF